jgi:hypothetical protein
MASQRYNVPLSELIRRINMLSGEVWPCGDIAPDEVHKVVRLGSLEERPWTFIESRSSESRGPNRLAWDAKHGATHIARIAYFVHHGIPIEDPDPIRMNVEAIAWGVGLPKNERSQKTECITLHISGRHRLAAAVIRGDKEIEIIFDGSQDILKQYLPGANPLPNQTPQMPRVTGSTKTPKA